MVIRWPHAKMKKNQKANDPTATKIEEEGPRTHRKQQMTRGEGLGKKTCFSPGASFSEE